jgi:hypothetical protein
VRVAGGSYMDLRRLRSFPMEDAESDFGVLAYMNTRANASELVEKFCLQKCVACAAPLAHSFLPLQRAQHRIVPHRICISLTALYCAVGAWTSGTFARATRRRISSSGRLGSPRKHRAARW